MRKFFQSASFVLALAVTITACDSVSPIDQNADASSELTNTLKRQSTAQVVVATLNVPEPVEGQFTVCKEAEKPGTFVFRVRVDLGNNGTIDTTTDFPVDVGNCALVHTDDDRNGDRVYIEELVTAGWSFDGGTVYNIADGNPSQHEFATTEIDGIIEEGKDGCVAVFRNVKDPVVTLEGRITGGGSVFDGENRGNDRVTHGFELHCDANDPPNNLQVNFQGNRFHLETLTSAVCTDDPAIDERPPTAGFDTYDGVGVGRYNGVSGFDIVFQLTDDGQPSNDIATILITDPNNGDAVILSVSGHLQSGNHQTHRQTGRR